MANLGTQGGNAAASENALSLSGSDSNAIAKDNGIALGANARLNTGFEFGTNTGSISIGDVGTSQALTDALTKITEANTSTLSAALQSSARSNLPTAVTELNANAEDSPLANVSRSWWIAGAAIVAGLILILLWRK